jgi:hypothetical protein
MVRASLSSLNPCPFNRKPLPVAHSLAFTSRYRRLEFDHPHVWLANLIAKRDNPKIKKQIYVPTLPKPIAAEYERYILSKLDSHVLLILNQFDELDDDTEAMLLRDLEAHAIAAGARAGVSFTPGRSTTTHIIGGQLSRSWLHSRVCKAVTYSIDNWDPKEAERRRDAAMRGGSNSSRRRTLTVADLPPGSVKAQAEATGVSERTIKRVRRDAAHARMTVDEAGSELLRGSILSASRRSHRR